MIVLEPTNAETNSLGDDSMKRRRGHWRNLLLALVIASMTIGLGTSAQAVSKGDILVVNADYTRMREKPEPGSKVLERIAKGKQVTFIKEYNGWVRVKLSGGRTGFIYKTFLSAPTTAKVGKMYASKLADGKLKVYNKPRKSSRVNGRLKHKTAVVLLERKGAWGRVRIVKNGKTGYVKLSNLRRV